MVQKGCYIIKWWQLVIDVTTFLICQRGNSCLWNGLYKQFKTATALLRFLLNMKKLCGYNVCDVCTCTYFRSVSHLGVSLIFGPGGSKVLS